MANLRVRGHVALELPKILPQLAVLLVLVPAAELALPPLARGGLDQALPELKLLAHALVDAESSK